jgi:hypothetical protein
MNEEEMSEFLIARFTKGNKDPMLVNNAPMKDDPYFGDYVRIGSYLSQGFAKQGMKTALVDLDKAMESEINKWYQKRSRALEYFTKQKKALEEKTPIDKDTDFSKLLNRALQKFERDHGFTVSEKLTTFGAFCLPSVFNDTLKNKMHFKDVVSQGHGEFTHRLQWYMVIKAGAIKSSINQEANVYAGIAPWQKGKTNLWTFLFDQPDEGEPTDFRCPEKLHRWLIGDSDPEFCPLLRAFLRSRNAKRAFYNVQDYFFKKFGPKGKDYFEEFLNGMSEKNKPSFRIVYDGSTTPVYKPFL